MSKYGAAVVYNGGQGKEHQLAIVRNAQGDTADLVVYDADTGQWSSENDVPRRDPADYGAGGGGGRTWHPHA
jgi:hypothetical protein